VQFILSTTAIVAAVSIALSSSVPAQLTVNAPTPSAAKAQPLVLAREEGERRIRRQKGGASDWFIIKVDPVNGGSQEFFMGYEDVPPGRTIPPHRHFNADEIIFIHKGQGAVEVGEIKRDFAEGATIFIPRNTTIAVKNTGSQPLSIAFIFSHPGFERLMRETSVREGEKFEPLTADQLKAIRAKHRDHVRYE
jgi:quercetin dioxygenase-like cupin family protein